MDMDLTRQEIQQRIDNGSDPSRDAGEAVREGRFGLISLGQRAPRPQGVTCFTPYGQAPRDLTHVLHGCVIDARVTAWYRYAEAYNRAIVTCDGYPDADLCRLSTAADRSVARANFPLTMPARPVPGTPTTLHEAARRGTVADMGRLLKLAHIDNLDGLGMTPLAWAVARNNAKAVDLLLNAKASPWASGSKSLSAVILAARFGRRAYFERMVRLPGKPFAEWDALYLGAAASGGNSDIIAAMLAQPHVRFRFEMVDKPLPDAAVLEPVLRSDPALAAALLESAVGYPGDRPDLVRLALRYRADPNAVVAYDTVLGTVVKDPSPTAVDIVDMLLKSGADPNLISHRRRPVWIIVDGLKKRDGHLALDDPALAIFRKLLDAKADLNIPDDQNVASARQLLFPYRDDRETLDTSFVTPALLELLELLVQNGLDLNTEWQGKRVLPAVEAQAGVNSVLAVALRKLGAHP